MGFDPQLRSISPSASFHETSGTSADARRLGMAGRGSSGSALRVSYPHLPRCDGTRISYPHVALVATNAWCQLIPRSAFES